MAIEPQRDSNLADPDRDLGFGAVVADSSRQRLLNRDGSFNVQRKGLAWRHIVSLYYTLLSLTWPRFILLTGLAYLATNGIFAVAYLLAGPGALEGTLSDRPFLQAYFFSVATLSTVGYGNIAPLSLSAHLLVTLEIMVGLFGVAVVAGLVFTRFSRPMAEIVFSRQAVVAPYQDMTALMFRIANLRRSQIIELSAKVLFSRFEVDERGQKHRRFYDLALERSKVTFFPLSWTIVHPIDEESPLNGEGMQSCLSAEAEFLVLLSGIDESFSQTVHARTSYLSNEIVWKRSLQAHPRATRGQASDLDGRRSHS